MGAPDLTGTPGSQPLGYTDRVTVIWTAFAVVMFLGLLVVHEAAHARALRPHGIPISEAGLGAPLAPRLVLKPTARRPYALSLSPWLIMAYVRVDDAHEERIEKLPYRDKAWFYGAGIIANAVVGTGLTALILLVQGMWVRAVVWAAVTAGLWFGRRVFVAYAVPALALPLVAFLVWSVVASLGEPAGLVGTARLLEVASALAALKIVAVMSLALAVLNMAPVFPFDGGRICAEVVRRRGGERAESAFQIAGVSVAVGLMAYAFVSDVGWLLLG